MEEIEPKEEQYITKNISFDDIANSQMNNGFLLFSKENFVNPNEYFETEFKKVFNDKDTFGQFRKEEEKDFETEKFDRIRINKKKIFKLIYNANKIVNKQNNFKKKIFTILSNNNFHNYSFHDIILYIKRLNRSSKTITSNVNKYNLLKMEHKLILELKNRILNEIKKNENL